MKKRTGRIALGLITGSLLVTVILTLWAGSRTIPPEVAIAQTAMATLDNSEVSCYLPDQYTSVREKYSQVLQRWNQELHKWIWLRQYNSFGKEFAAISTSCTQIKNELAIRIQKRIKDLSTFGKELATRASNLRQFTLTINEGRIARKDLTRAELRLAQSAISLKYADVDQAEAHLNQSDRHLSNAENHLYRILKRYQSNNQIDRWRAWINTTLNESRRHRSLVVVVSKLDRKLVVYRNGAKVRTFKVGLGRNALSDKRQSGDYATPEGRYRIHRKNPHSLYHKALLLDYPNNEDRRSYQKARKNGLIPPQAGIGGLIEIHGGGISFMTRGCIALENDDMDALYNLLPTGTPVTIVGSTDKDEQLITLFKELSSEQD